MFLLVLLGLNAAFAIATFLYAFISHAVSDHFDQNVAAQLATSMAPKGFYLVLYPGNFDLETWTCETKDITYLDRDGVLHAICAQEVSSRWMTLPTALLAGLLFGALWHDTRGGRYLMTTWKERRQSWTSDRI